MIDWCADRKKISSDCKVKHKDFPYNDFCDCRKVQCLVVTGLPVCLTHLSFFKDNSLNGFIDEACVVFCCCAGVSVGLIL